MKKVSLIAGIASLAMVAGVLWSLPVAAASTFTPHDKWPARSDVSKLSDTDADDSTSSDPASVPEPDTLALLALGLGGIGAYGLSRRRRVKA